MEPCKFCNPKNEILWENERVFVVLGRPHHKGHVAVVLKEHHELIEEISEELAKNFFYDAFRVSQVIRNVLKVNKMNFELLGNWVPHLHWHIIPRFEEDSDFGNPPKIPRKTEKYERRELTEEELGIIKKELKKLST